MSHSPRLVGITATTPIIHNALNLLKEIKRRDSQILTMIGGPHVSALPVPTLKENPGVIDFAVGGEGEHSAYEIVQAIEAGVPFQKEIPGIAFWRDGQIISGPCRPREQNIDIFGYPARHLFPMDRYIDTTKYGQELYTLMTTSRGCPGMCTFCGSRATWGRLVRFRSVDDVLGEIQECAEKFGLRNIVFCDDTFTLQRKRTIEICRKIIELPYKLRIYCSSRPDTISKDRLEWLKKAGCYCVTFGIESGNDEILRRMKKHTTTAMVRKAVRMTQEAGVEVHGSFIIGNVGDTEETIEETVQFALELNLDQIQFSILIPLPGTEIFQLAEETKAFRGEPNNYERFFWYYSVAANFTRLPDERLIEIQKKAYERWQASKGATRISLRSEDKNRT